ncbi:Hypothetical protein PP7435_CHR1-0172 [Komagataella phaffii CBS 7435]|uniref:Uncharacterized protein n=2 Tax=Komagataella phaffii TaxID=460519 RepID=C4QVF8_KOMPG|nr:Hypothetical protein PAS_chr1-3_0169 [Komagataella phaffii GS115]AOA60475.1 GQ67_02423T0 [Komagataella phaffii]KAI0465346.1 hypothetical protein LJB42_000578 [Komagataella kurtzmanii]CAH2445887.1 Hypothetical protein BQ9382_C1-0905 [Komagataella phaffii CBS 7435]AOA65459.1 GQ68_02824T0 [Komagataella phaffii GS115]CAY67231.1 Hypothetical protein PAS_chr1-3_0169 [Komagataella phaffii GS115]
MTQTTPNLKEEVTSKEQLNNPLKTVHHLSQYPLLKQAWEYVVGFAWVGWVWTNVIQLYTILRVNVVDRVPFVASLLNALDSSFEYLVLQTTDRVLPFLTELTYQDLISIPVKNYELLSKRVSTRWEDLKRSVRPALNPVLRPGGDVLSKFVTSPEDYADEVERLYLIASKTYGNIYEKGQIVTSKINSAYQSELSSKDDQKISDKAFAAARTSRKLSNEFYDNFRQTTNTVLEQTKGSVDQLLEKADKGIKDTASTINKSLRSNTVSASA